jgi:RimJ/RimL family protein N-acetyltransferase
MDTFRFRDGTEVAIRPIRPDDGPRISAAYRLLSPESRYARFLAAKPNLTSSEVEYLVDVDPANHVALVATLARDPERIVGVARFVRLPDDPRVAEFAVVIGDQWQGQRLASELLRRLARQAPAYGIDRVRATMLADNERAHRLLNGLAGPRSLRRRGPVDELEIDLAD